MNFRGIFILLVLATFNGIYSPVFPIIFSLSPIWYPGLLPNSVSLVFFFSSLMISTITLMISGVPAALYERFAVKLKLPYNDFIVTGIWILVASLITLPAFRIYLNISS